VHKNRCVSCGEESGRAKVLEDGFEKPDAPQPIQKPSKKNDFLERSKQGKILEKLTITKEGSSSPKDSASFSVKEGGRGPTLLQEYEERVAEGKPSSWFSLG